MLAVETGCGECVWEMASVLYDDLDRIDQAEASKIKRYILRMLNKENQEVRSCALAHFYFFDSRIKNKMNTVK